MRKTLKYSILALSALIFTGCVLVDQDMSDCETDYTIDYELRLVTNMTTELQTQLSMAADVNVSAALNQYMSGIFTDYAHDVNLSFYDVYGDSLRLHNERHIMDANQSSYTLFIPVRKYMHVAIANIEDNHEVGLEADELCHTSRLVQPVRDTVESHPTGIFTARLPMDIKDGEEGFRSPSKHHVTEGLLQSGFIEDINLFREVIFSDIAVYGRHRKDILVKEGDDDEDGVNDRDDEKADDEAHLVETTHHDGEKDDRGDGVTRQKAIDDVGVPLMRLIREAGSEEVK